MNILIQSFKSQQFEKKRALLTRNLFVAIRNLNSISQHTHTHTGVDRKVHIPKLVAIVLYTILVIVFFTWVSIDEENYPLIGSSSSSGKF